MTGGAADHRGVNAPNHTNAAASSPSPVVRFVMLLAAGLALLGAGFGIGSATRGDESPAASEAPEGLAFVGDAACNDIIGVVTEVAAATTIDETTLEQLATLRGLVAAELAPNMDRLIAAYTAVAEGDLDRIADETDTGAIDLAAQAVNRHLAERCGIDPTDLDRD